MTDEHLANVVRVIERKMGKKFHLTHHPDGKLSLMEADSGRQCVSAGSPEALELLAAELKDKD